jgi:hypothetical protein
VAIYSRNVPQCTASQHLQFSSSAKTFSCVASLPSGFIGLIVMGACPTGTSEVASLNAKTLVGTLAANGNVGGIGGVDAITPAGTVAAPTFTGTALGTHLHSTGTYATSAHSGTAVADHAAHTHTFTQSANATTPDLLTVNTAAAGVAASGTTGNPNATLTHSVTQPSAHTLSGSSEAVSAGTPAGSNSAPAFTGTQFDNRSAFTRVIFCQAS